jgi:hypothetical protein
MIILCLGLIVVVIALGGTLWVGADNQTKAVDLGAGLVSAGVFGVLLVLLERALAQQGERIERRVGLSAAPPPAVDASAATRSSEGEQTPEAVVNGGPPDTRRLFTVEREGWIRDSSRIDAEQVRLRTFADGQYFQFFTGILSGTDFRLAIHGPSQITLAQFRRAFTDITVELVRHAVSIGKAPHSDPTVAIELFPDAAEAARRARHVEDHDYEDDEVVAQWQG